MKFEKLAAKVSDYNERLADGQARKIKPEHVRKVLEKLRSKESQLAKELAASHDYNKQVRLTGKLKIAREQISRAEWLLKEIG